jgi:hypothetical protein
MGHMASWMDQEGVVGKARRKSMTKREEAEDIRRKIIDTFGDEADLTKFGDLIPQEDGFYFLFQSPGMVKPAKILLQKPQ